MVPLDDNRLMSTLVDRRGILETFELNIEPTAAVTQSTPAKVDLLCTVCESVHGHIISRLAPEIFKGSSAADL